MKRSTGKSFEAEIARANEAYERAGIAKLVRLHDSRQQTRDGKIFFSEPVLCDFMGIDSFGALLLVEVKSRATCPKKITPASLCSKGQLARMMNWDDWIYRITEVYLEAPRVVIVAQLGGRVFAWEGKHGQQWNLSESPEVQYRVVAGAPTWDYLNAEVTS